MYRGPGRPPQYVEYNGRTVVGLSLKSDGRYYSTHNDPLTGKRVYFGYDLADAVKAFRAWKRRLAA
jgi:hypothetical protein